MAGWLAGDPGDVRRRYFEIVRVVGQDRIEVMTIPRINPVPGEAFGVLATNHGVVIVALMLRVRTTLRTSRHLPDRQIPGDADVEHVVARPGRQLQGLPADPECPDLLGHEPVVVRPTEGPKRLALDGHADDLRVEGGNYDVDSNIVRSPERRVRPSVHAGDERAGDPVATNGDRADPNVGVANAPELGVSGQNGGVPHPPADRDTGDVETVRRVSWTLHRDPHA